MFNSYGPIGFWQTTKTSFSSAQLTYTAALTVLFNLNDSSCAIAIWKTYFDFGNEYGSETEQEILNF